MIKKTTMPVTGMNKRLQSFKYACTTERGNVNKRCKRKCTVVELVTNYFIKYFI